MIKFLPFDFLGVSPRILLKNENAVYRLQIPAFANEMTDDVIHSTQYYIMYINSYLGQFAAQTIETW